MSDFVSGDAPLSSPCGLLGAGGERSQGLAYGAGPGGGEMG